MLLSRRRLLAASAPLLFAAGAVTATQASGVLAAAPAAAPTTSASPAPQGTAAGKHGDGRHQFAREAKKKFLEIIAKDTGLTTQQVTDQLKAGKSINDIAGSKAPAVKADALAALKGFLDTQVTAGNLTKEREQAILAKAPAALDKMMAAHHTPGQGKHGKSPASPAPTKTP